MKSIKIIMCIFLLSGSDVYALNLSDTPNIFGLGLSFGGDTLGSAGSDKLKAGEEVSLFYGRIIDAGEELHYQFNIGFKLDTIAADNGDAMFYRVPVDFLLFRKLGNFRIGGGATYHIAPTYEMDAGGSTSTIDFNNAFGVIFQLDFIGWGSASAGIRFESVNYASEEVLFDLQTGRLKSHFDGSNTGFILRYHFK